MSDTPTTVEERLAEMSQRIIDNRKRDHAESIALRMFRTAGTVDGAAVQAELDKTWVDPDPQEIADLVARKAATAVEYHQREAKTITERHANREAKAAELEAQAAALRAAPADTAADDIAYAEAVAAAAAEHGDAARAPAGNDAVASAAVAEAVGEAISNGGN